MNDESFIRAIGEAVARAMGEAPGRFLEVLWVARSSADHDAIEGSAAAQALVQWVRARRRFRGTYTQFLGELNASAEPGARREPNWPRNAQTLSGLVRRIAPALRRIGIGIKHEKVGHERTRVVTINYEPVTSATTSSAPPTMHPNPISLSGLSADDAVVAAPPSDRPHQATLAGPAHVAVDPLVEADARQATPSSATQGHASEADPTAADGADDLRPLRSTGLSRANTPTTYTPANASGGIEPPTDLTPPQEKP